MKMPSWLKKTKNDIEASSSRSARHRRKSPLIGGAGHPVGSPKRKV
jgi:hypothetical protein